MSSVKGTEGYGASVDRFIAATEAVDFSDLHSPYLDLIPTNPSRVLDIGAGVGRDASILAEMGHTVTAVEPMRVFLNTGTILHSSRSIEWIEDSLPYLANVRKTQGEYEFILVSGVWHHIDDTERLVAMSRIAELLVVGGIFAVSLRNGPAGAGTHVFRTDAQLTIRIAKKLGLDVIVELHDQPSLISGKDGVKWAKLAFKRR